MSELPIRPVSYDEYDALHHVFHLAFGLAPDPEEAERERGLLEFDRTLAAMDGGRVVATAGAYSLDLTVPGGSVPTAGVTWVSVSPTHRRRGILRSLMRRQLDDIHEAGREPIAALWASEPAIYGRFGYGMAATSLSMVIARGSTGLRPVEGSGELRVRLVEAEESLALCHPVYEHDRARRAGMFALSPAWQQMSIYVPERMREGGSPLRTVVVEDADGGVRAYARYLTRAKWATSGPDGTVTVRAAHARDAAAAHALWSFLLNLDLMGSVELRLRPVDDPLVLLLLDFRRAEASLSDSLHVRIVDLAAALAARTYAIPVDVVLDVRDEVCPWNAGRWRLSGDATGGSCERTAADPDISLDVRALGAAYLGGTSLLALADAGSAAELSPGAVRELASALRQDPAPWCPWIY